jgi:methionyl aminopeptidase
MNKLVTMRNAGILGNTIFKRVAFDLKPIATTMSINKLVKKILEVNNAQAEFKNYGDPPFPAETCISINEEVCHGVPCNRKITNGDIVSVDMGIRVQDYVVDACQTFEIGEVSEEVSHLNYWTKIALKRAVRNVKAGVCWNEIASIIENTAKNKNLSVIRGVTGHGIGKELHEFPSLRNYVCEENEDIFLEEDQTICIEPMFSLGNGESETLEDEWTIVTIDRTLSSHWEHCLRVTKTGCEIFL